MKFPWLVAACVLVLSNLASAQVATLQIRVLEGEGVVHPPGSRSSHPIVVEVTDETGMPVDRATVSLHMPNEGPGGTFVNGLRTEVGMTDAKGRFAGAAVQWNRQPGRFQIRIVASLEDVRAGMLSAQYIGDSGTRAAASPVAPSLPHAPAARSASTGRTKWIVIVGLLAAGATAGALNGARSSASPTPQAAAVPKLSIGTPTITVGKP